MLVVGDEVVVRDELDTATPAAEHDELNRVRPVSAPAASPSHAGGSSPSRHQQGLNLNEDDNPERTPPDAIESITSTAHQVEAISTDGVQQVKNDKDVAEATSSIILRPASAPAGVSPLPPPATVVPEEKTVLNNKHRYTYRGLSFVIN